jgi:hypothetical protein
VKLYSARSRLCLCFGIAALFLAAASLVWAEPVRADDRKPEARLAPKHLVRQSRMLSIFSGDQSSGGALAYHALRTLAYDRLRAFRALSVVHLPEIGPEGFRHHFGGAGN